MAITGGVKLFDRNQALFKDGATASASSNNDSAKLMLDVSKYTRWESLGSNDLTTETITISLNSATTIDRLFLSGINLKQFTIRYNGGTEFTNVIGLDGSLVGGISEISFADTTAYYEFDSVSVSTIEITATTTQVADEQKYITQAIATTEIGTMAGFPRVNRVRHNRNSRQSKVLSGLAVIQKSYETTSFSLNFKTYPVQADVNILQTLHTRETSFLVWLCGGRRGIDNFRIIQRGWRLEDVYNMQMSKPLGSDYAKGIYSNGIDSRLDLVEVI